MLLAFMCHHGIDKLAKRAKRADQRQLFNLQFSLQWYHSCNYLHFVSACILKLPLKRCKKITFLIRDFSSGYPFLSHETHAGHQRSASHGIGVYIGTASLGIDAQVHVFSSIFETDWQSIRGRNIFSDYTIDKTCWIVANTRKIFVKSTALIVKKRCKAFQSA